MELKLSCVCCGNTEFSTEMGIITTNLTNGCSHTHNVNIVKDNKIICSKCGLEDYIKNLEIKICYQEECE